MTESFYDTLAPYYKYIYKDWDKSITKQAAVLKAVIEEYVGYDARTILDVACGIGTQSIGLAKLGYELTASDISAREIEQAQIEAKRHHVELDFHVADMREVNDVFSKKVDVLIACDNAIPHLLSDLEIKQTFQKFHQCIKPGGGCIISVRDYSQLIREPNEKKMYPRQVIPHNEGQLILFDVWDFDDKDHYEITTYLIKDHGSQNPTTEVARGGKYYCVELPTLEQLFLEVGFQSAITLRDRFFQPLIVAMK